MAGELAWHILWSPTGFGSTSAKLVELCTVLRQTDESAEAYFPTYLEHARDQDIMVPLFPNYVFVRCRWHMGLEDRIRDTTGVFVTFLRPVGGSHPYGMTEDDLATIKQALESQAALVRQWIHAGDLIVGDRVMVRSMSNLAGTILYFIPPSRAMIETVMFNQVTPVAVKISELVKL